MCALGGVPHVNVNVTVNVHFDVNLFELLTFVLIFSKF